MKEFFIFPITFILSFLGVYILRRWFLRREILDIPNERSSHDRPVPRGGGLILVILILGFYLAAALSLQMPLRWSYLAGGVLIALVSWLDDIFTLSIGWRFPVHCLAAILVIFELGFWREIYLLFDLTYKAPGWFGALLTFGWIIWLTNAYNFMDGIDGIAGLQAVIAGFGWYLAGYLLLEVPQTGLLGGVLACAGLGFLLHNWQPAKIFMGDIGSAFLGYTLAVFPLLAGSENPSLKYLFPLTAGIFVWLFLFDSVLTFWGRLFRRERVWQAHRGHIYQKLIISGYSHQFVSILYGIISIILGGIWLFCLKFTPDYDYLILVAVIVLSAGLLIFGLINFSGKTKTQIDG